MYLYVLYIYMYYIYIYTVYIYMYMYYVYFFIRISATLAQTHRLSSTIRAGKCRKHVHKTLSCRTDYRDQTTRTARELRWEASRPTGRHAVSQFQTAPKMVVSVFQLWLIENNTNHQKYGCKATSLNEYLWIYDLKRCAGSFIIDFIAKNWGHWGGRWIGVETQKKNDGK